MLKVFHIRKNRVKSKTDHNYTIDTGERKFYLPVDQVMKVTEYRLGASKWYEFSVTQWIWNKTDLPKKFQNLRDDGHFMGQGDTRFNINWDYVLQRRRNIHQCFYCLKKLNDKNRTKDHVIPKAIIKAFGIKPIPNNTVPCCRGCNQLKSSMHPSMFRDAVKYRLHKSGNTYFRIVLQTLDELLKI